MRCGLFGKLPAKRDFVALAAPREFLGLWERWLQGAVSASRAELGPNWQTVFLQAPIWRFWLGAELGGTTVAGAFMPSVDGVGRYFPLTVFAAAEAGEALPPPELDLQDAWFTAAEDILLSALAPETNYETVAAAVAQLPPPSAGQATASPAAALGRLPRGTLVLDGETDGLAERFAAARLQDHARSYAATSYWWTLGGEGFRPLALIEHRMPDPYVFSGMLTGRFDGAAATARPED
jgi:type VI secretion system protein ImpM